MTPVERAREELANVERVPPGHFVSVSREGMTTICRAMIAAEERAQELERALRGVIRESDRNTDAYIYARSLLTE